MLSGAFTLVELLMAIAIVALLFAVGVGLYMRMNRGFALRAAVSSLESALRAARAAAVHDRSLAVVMVVERQVEPPPALPQVERVYALGKRAVSCWHFEFSQLQGTKLAGTFGGALTQQGKVVGTAVTAPGRIGKALSLDGLTYVTAESPHLDAIRDGVFVEAFVWPSAAGPTDNSRLVIASRRDDAGKGPFSLALRCTVLSSGLRVFSLEGSVTTASETLSAHTEPIIPAGEWTHVAMAYVGDAMDAAGKPVGIVLQVNGEDVDRFDVKAGNGPLAASAAPLYLGGEKGGTTGTDCFIGYLDELKIAALASGEVQSLPKNAVVVRVGAAALAKQGDAKASVAVRFDEEGKLDRRTHGTIVRFRVESADSERLKQTGEPLPTDYLRRVVQVNWLGGVEVFQDEREVE